MHAQAMRAHLALRSFGSNSVRVGKPSERTLIGATVEVREARSHIEMPTLSRGFYIIKKPSQILKEIGGLSFFFRESGL